MKVGGASLLAIRGTKEWKKGASRDAPATIGGFQLAISVIIGKDVFATMSQINELSNMWEYFNPWTEIDIRVSGNLPHWEQVSVWYFVTFRLEDALPRAVVEAIRQKREQWLSIHNLENLTREELVEYHRMFSQRYENLLNSGSGSCVLREPENMRIVDGAFRFFDGRRYALDEYVVMPNHVHVLVKPMADYDLAGILHSWKSYTANRINRRMGRSGQLWQHESYDHIVRNGSAMDAIRRYIRDNPIMKG